MAGPDDIKFMKRCQELALKAEGNTYPNPVVGSVIVHDGTIIGEGYHLKAGGPHAEVIAINAVKDRELLHSSTLYVNLEPCSHFGKTPPCADLIISSGIPRVVIGTADTSEKVSGKGAARVRDAGIKVVTGVAEDECRWINRRFFTFSEKKRPHIILKWAQSRDGYIDILRPEGAVTAPTWITGRPERILVHRWRATEQAVMVGAGTVRADDPQLNVREWTGSNPVRIILNGSGVLPAHPALNKSAETNIIFTYHPGKAGLENAIVVKLDHGRSAAEQISDYLYRKGIQSLLIEGGAQVLAYFIATGLWDEARIFTGRKDFNKGIKAPEIKGKRLFLINFERSSLEIVIPGHG